MPLSEGHWIGVYEIVRPLGAGEIGEVYRARDSRLTGISTTGSLTSGVAPGHLRNVADDGQRFLVSGQRATQTDTTTAITVLLNWAAALRPPE